MSKVMYYNPATKQGVIAGYVKAVSDDGEKVRVWLGYDVCSKGEDGKWVTSEGTTNVYVRNGSMPYADYARQMNIRKGSSLIAYVIFSDEQKKNASGYSLKYDGTMSVANGWYSMETENGRDRKKPADKIEEDSLIAAGYEKEYNYVVKGLVTNVTKKVASNGTEYLSCSVYTGKAKDGSLKSEHVNIMNKDSNQGIVSNAEKLLSPRANGTKVAAAFLCGTPYCTLKETAEGDLVENRVYSAFEFSITGHQAKQQNAPAAEAPAQQTA